MQISLKLVGLRLGLSFIWLFLCFGLFCCVFWGEGVQGFLAFLFFPETKRQNRPAEGCVTKHGEYLPYLIHTSFCFLMEFHWVMQIKATPVQNYLKSFPLMQCQVPAQEESLQVFHFAPLSLWCVCVARRSQKMRTGYVLAAMPWGFLPMELEWT